MDIVQSKESETKGNTTKMVEQASHVWRRTLLRCPSKIAGEQTKSVALPTLNETNESQKGIPLAKKDSQQNGKRLNPWSKEGLVACYEAGLNVQKGLSLPPHVVPYRFLGTPDLKRDDLLLPKEFQFAQRMRFTHSNEHEDHVQRVKGEPMVLPLKLKEAFWNGERWQGTSQTGSEAKRSNGFDALYSEVVKSQKRVILCKTGQYFLAGDYAPSEDEVLSKSRTSSIVSEIPQRQHKHRASVAKPFIPPLPLKNLPEFEESVELGHHQEVLLAYGAESNRYETARLLPESERTSQENNVLLSGRTISGLPLKACGKTCLRQLGNILRTSMSYNCMQNSFNQKLEQSLRAIQTTRPYHFTREFGMKHKGYWDPTGTPRRASTFRRHLARLRWYTELLEMVYTLTRHPTKTEVLIIEDIRRVLDAGGVYSKESFTSLFLDLIYQKEDLENIYTQMALIHVQNALKVSDLELVTDLLLNRAKLPSWLESKTRLVKQAMRAVSPNLFPNNKMVAEENRKKTPVTKLRKLYWMKDKIASLRQRRESRMEMGDVSLLSNNMPTSRASRISIW